MKRHMFTVLFAPAINSKSEPTYKLHVKPHNKNKSFMFLQMPTFSFLSALAIVTTTYCSVLATTTGTLFVPPFHTAGRCGCRALVPTTSAPGGSSSRPLRHLYGITPRSNDKNSNSPKELSCFALNDTILASKCPIIQGRKLQSAADFQSVHLTIVGLFVIDQLHTVNNSADAIGEPAVSR